METHIGLDLGATNSAIAYLHPRTGEAELVPAWDGPDALFPSDTTGYAFRKYEVADSPEVAILLLKKLKDEAEKFLEKPVGRAVHEVPERLAEYHDRLQSIQEGETVAWEDTIWHEVGHIRDKYLGFDGKFLSEMPGSPFGKEPWASEYAEETGKPYEDFAEAYKTLIQDREVALAAGLPEATFHANATEDQLLGEKNRFILEHFWGIKFPLPERDVHDS